MAPRRGKGRQTTTAEDRAAASVARKRTAHQQLNAAAHLLRSSMALGTRVNVTATPELSCIGVVRRLADEVPSSEAGEFGSTLVAYVNTGVQTMRVPLNVIREVTEA